MAHIFQAETAVVEHAASALFDETQEWEGTMDNGEAAVISVTDKLEQGFRAYVRDLPQLIKDKREGHMIAYHGEEMVGIAPTDGKLHQILARKPHFDQIKEDTFVTRVTAMDAAEYGVRL